MTELSDIEEISTRLRAKADLAKSLGLSSTHHISTHDLAELCDIIARIEARARTPKVARWFIGCVCFWIGALCHWVVT